MVVTICAKHEGIWYYAEIHVTKVINLLQQQMGEIAFQLPDGTKIAFHFPRGKGTAQTKVIKDHGNMPLFMAKEVNHQKAAEKLYSDH